MIDVNRTRERFADTGRNISLWARVKGLDPERMRAVLRGAVAIRGDEEAALREDGLMVEADEAANG